MSVIQQHRAKLEYALLKYLGIRTTIIAMPIVQVLATSPDYKKFLVDTYGLSVTKLDSEVFRYSIGNHNLSSKHSDIYDTSGDLIRKPKVSEYGIICQQGILTFYEDVYCSRDIYILAASYHFQTAPQEGRNPLYTRFEFDPLVSPRRNYTEKPIFHYHFSNYKVFHKRCHFPAGHFKVEDPAHHPFDDEKLKNNFTPPNIPKLSDFLALLRRTELI